MTPEFTKEGFWWARGHTPEPGAADDGEPCYEVTWEPVEVVRNHPDHAHPAKWRVFVLGVEKLQSPENFEWGAQIERPERYNPKEDRT